MSDPYKYEVGVKKIIDEGEEFFQGSVKEFPDLTVFSETYAEAYELMIDAIRASIDFLAEQGKRIPEPLESVENYSGRVTLRMPKTIHREIAVSAKEDGVSLNQFILNSVTYYTGFIAGKNSVENKDWNVSRDGERRSITLDGESVTVYKASEISKFIKNSFQEFMEVRVAPVVTVKSERIDYKEKIFKEFDDSDKHFVPVPR